MIRASLQFAADTKVLAQVHSDAERTKLQEDLDKLTEWAKKSTGVTADITVIGWLLHIPRLHAPRREVNINSIRATSFSAA